MQTRTIAHCRRLALLALSVTPTSFAAAAWAANQDPAAAVDTVRIAQAAAPADADTPETLVRRRRAQGEAAPSTKPAVPADESNLPRPMSPGLTPAQWDAAQFRPDPSYPENSYDVDKQTAIYGGKHALSTPRPLIELGYPMYAAGALGATHDWLGEKNLMRPQFLVYGDWRTAYGYNKNAVAPIEKSLFATRLNLETDLKLTGTERLHALFRPLDKNGKFTRDELRGANTPDGKDAVTEFTLRPSTGYFEGDLGQITQGVTGSYNGVDLPIAAGLVPLLFQNGIWMDDSFDGLAVTVPAKHSETLDISNFDVTMFAGFDEVSTAALGLQKGQLATHAGSVFGVASFFERRTYYYELDYGYLEDQKKLGGVDHSYHNISAAVTHRFRDILSYSLRVIENVGQEAGPGGVKTADGTLVLLETSFITSRPYTLVPYLNLFYGDRSPQAMARDAGSGGVLKNTGLNFETDGLTGFPKMEDTGANTYGGAFGLEYLFNLDRQIVFEAAALNHRGNLPVDDKQYGFGLRYQQPISDRWIIRADGVVIDHEHAKNASGVRVELRCKF